MGFKNGPFRFGTVLADHSKPECLIESQEEYILLRHFTYDLLNSIDFDALGIELRFIRTEESRCVQRRPELRGVFENAHSGIISCAAIFANILQFTVTS